MWWKKQHWDRFFSEYFHFHLSVSFNKSFVLTPIQNDSYQEEEEQSTPKNVKRMFFIY
jgi:hypothetical protein